MQLEVDEVGRALAGDGEFTVAIRYWTAVVAFELGDDAYVLEIVDGAVSGFRAERAEAPDVLVAGPDADWREILAATPRPYFQDVLSGVRFGTHSVAVTGDPLGTVFPRYQAIQRAVDVIRNVVHPKPQRPVADVTRRFDVAVGRYVYLTIAGVQYRVYFEESGSGIPLLLHHTAGSDGRQFRHLLEDPDLQRRFRMISYDLPYHGKSNPPSSRDWWATQYRLTLDFMVEFIDELSVALDVSRAVFCGCSVGGLFAPDLALLRPDLFRAVISLNGVVKVASKLPDPVMDQSWFDPRIASDWHASWMLGRTAPAAPEAWRRETAWYYAQAGPGVLRGDLHYYQAEHDLSGRLHEIDTSRCAVYVVAGEYDPSRVAPFGAPDLAAGISGAKYQIAEGMGHFMMSEDPERFRDVVVPILDEIAGSG